MLFFFFFFFQAEDGIRDKLVTGVQTCALPISEGRESAHGNHHHRAAQQSLGQRPHFDGHGRGWTGDGVRGGRSPPHRKRGGSPRPEKHTGRGPRGPPSLVPRSTPHNRRGQHSTTR